jgi:putative ABC transport system permease protein
LVNRLVFENLRHRPVRTLLSTVAIGVQVTMILTLVGVSRGMIDDMRARSRAVGADIMVKDAGSALIGFSTNFSDKYLAFIRKQPHVVAVAGTLIQPVGGVESVTGIDLGEFNAVSGGFIFLQGGPFRHADDMIVDEIYAATKGVRAGMTINVLNRSWNIAGVVRSGKLSRMFVDRGVLQGMFANDGKLTTAYIKLDDPVNTPRVVDNLRAQAPALKVWSMEEFVSLLSVDNVPMLKKFIWVIITLGVLIGFLVVFLSMYTAVLERTREIGILKALGASPGYVLGILLRETALLAVAGSITGILMTYGTQWLINTFVSEMRQQIVPDWWPIAALIAITGAMLGAAYPGLKAARQDAIEALAYD